jgi:hypothetical protein
MEFNYKDPFISKLKNNLNNSSNIYQNNSMTNIPSINKNVNELLNDEELSKKIGRMETILNYYEAKIKNEFNERKLLEERLESLTLDVYHMKDNLENMTKLFTENFSKIKNNIIEIVESKNNSMNQLVLESTKRLNTLEDILLNNNNSNDAIYQQKSLQNFEIIGTNKSVNNSILISTQRDSSFMKQNYTSVQNDKYDFLFGENTVLCECVRSLSKKRLGKFVGQIEQDDLEEVLKTQEYAYKNANKITKERRVNEWF